MVDRAAMERRLGLDLPIHVQYGRWIGGILLRGTLGESLLGGWRNEQRMLGRLPVTAELGVLAIVIGLVIALPVGIYSAVRQYTAADYLGRSVAIMGLATPNFWLGTMVMIYPAIWWTWSPRMELVPLAQDPLGNLGMFLIPSLILGTYLSASTMRMTRNMMLEVLRQDYIRTAWAKGLLERSVILRHAVKNAISTCSATRCATCWTRACAAASAATAPAERSGVNAISDGVDLDMTRACFEA